MTYYVIKIVVTTILVVAISEIARRSSFLGGLLASVPLISVMAFVWLYIDTKDVEKVSALALNVFWLVIPSLALFITLPVLLRRGVDFYASMLLSIAITVACYWVMVMALHYFGTKL